MAITQLDPNTIHLGGELTLINTIEAVETITPGMVLHYENSSGDLVFGVHDTADDPVAAFVALEQDELNKTVDDTYAAGDLMKVGHMEPGATFWGIIPSGQTINPGDLLQSNGDGKLKAVATGVAKFVALEAQTATADTRIRVEVL